MKQNGLTRRLGAFSFVLLLAALAWGVASAAVCACEVGAVGCIAEPPAIAPPAPLVLPKGDPSLPACRGCGCKGGPGYRAPNGRCVAWAELLRTCGRPLPGACAAEIADPRAEEIVEGLARRAGEPARR